MRMDYQIIVISEVHHARGKAVKGSSPLSIYSFDVTQTILLFEVTKTVDMSSRWSLHYKGWEPLL